MKTSLGSQEGKIGYLIALLRSHTRIDPMRPVG